MLSLTFFSSISLTHLSIAVIEANQEGTQVVRRKPVWLKDSLVWPVGSRPWRAVLVISSRPFYSDIPLSAHQ